MKKCKCEHWQTCPVCYPQGFDEAGNRKLVEIPPTRGEMLARIKELEAELLNREGMTCGDCNDTGWLENREEGRYPCTCMTEAEPYQLLEAERDALAMQNQQMRSYLVNAGVLGYKGAIDAALASHSPTHPRSSSGTMRRCWLKS